MSAVFCGGLGGRSSGGRSSGAIRAAGPEFSGGDHRSESDLTGGGAVAAACGDGASSAGGTFANSGEFARRKNATETAPYATELATIKAVWKGLIRRIRWRATSFHNGWKESRFRLASPAIGACSGQRSIPRCLSAASRTGWCFALKGTYPIAAGCRKQGDMWSILNADPSLVDGCSSCSHRRFHAAAVTYRPAKHRQQSGEKTAAQT